MLALLMVLERSGFMNFQEIGLIPIAKCITQSPGWAAAALLPTKSHLGAEVQPVLRSPSPGGGQLHLKKGSFFLMC